MWGYPLKISLKALVLCLGCRGRSAIREVSPPRGHCSGQASEWGYARLCQGTTRVPKTLNHQLDRYGLQRFRRLSPPLASNNWPGQEALHRSPDPPKFLGRCLRCRGRVMVSASRFTTWTRTETRNRPPALTLSAGVPCRIAIR